MIDGITVDYHFLVVKPSATSVTARDLPVRLVNANAEYPAMLSK